MDLTQLANLGEFIGGVAVLVTLIYLAIQVRQSNQNDRLSALKETIALYSSHGAIVASDEHVGAFVKGLRDYGSLGPEERVKFNMCVAGYLNVIEVTRAHQTRLDDVVEAVGPYFGSRLFAYSGFRDWWEHDARAGFLPETIAVVDQLVEAYRDSPGFWERVHP